MKPTIYIPRPEGLNAEFYRRALGGKLHLQRCLQCRRFRHPPRQFCPACGSDRYDWTASPGRGRVFSWTVTHIAYDRGWETRLPYATVVVELDEGPRLVGALEGIEHSRLRIGLPLAARLEPMGEDFVFISFHAVNGEEK